MGSRWSEEQAAQPQQQPATNNTATRSDEHNNNLSNSLMEEKKKVVGGKLGAEVKLAHGLEAILKDADLEVDRSSLDKLHDHLYAGIFLNKRTKIRNPNRNPSPLQPKQSLSPYLLPLYRQQPPV